MVLLASWVQCPVWGLHTSAAWTAPDRVLKPPALVPPVTSTWPSGRIVAFRCRRAKCIGSVLLQLGPVRFRLIVSAVAVGAPVLGSVLFQSRVPPPPTYRTVPVSYITAEP